MDEVGAIHDIERLADVVVGDEDGQAGVAEVFDDLLHVVDGNRIDAAKRLVQHEESSAW